VTAAAAIFRSGGHFGDHSALAARARGHAGNPGRLSKIGTIRHQPGELSSYRFHFVRATLAYLIAQYRLQSMMNHIFPVDSRRREGPPRWHVGILSLRYQPEIAKERRSPKLVSREEIGLLILALDYGRPWLSLLAFVSFELGQSGFSDAGVARDPDDLDCGCGSLYRVRLLHYWAQRHMTPRKPCWFFRMSFGRKRAREQRRINRWLAWARLRRSKDV